MAPPGGRCFSGGMEMESDADITLTSLAVGVPDAV